MIFTFSCTACYVDGSNQGGYYISAMLRWSDLKGRTNPQKQDRKKHAESGMLKANDRQKSLENTCSLASHLGGTLALRRNKKDDNLAAQKFTGTEKRRV